MTQLVAGQTIRTRARGCCCRPWRCPGRLEVSTPLWAAGLLQLASTGNGGPVVVLPGFTLDDRPQLGCGTSSACRSGRGLGLGRNIGPPAQILDGIDDLVERSPTSTVSRSASSAGRSAASSPARGRAPPEVRRVITLGSPYRLVDHHKSHAAWMYEMYAAPRRRRRPAPGGPASQPLSVPSTSVYSRSDGIVPWWRAPEPSSARRERRHPLQPQRPGPQPAGDVRRRRPPGAPGAATFQPPFDPAPSGWKPVLRASGPQTPLRRPPAP